MKNTETKDKLERAPIYWIREAIEYLGLDRLGLAGPEKAMCRRIDKRALRHLHSDGLGRWQ